VGIDVAKAPLDIAVRPSGQQWVTATDPVSLDDLGGLGRTWEDSCKTCSLS